MKDILEMQFTVFMYAGSNERVTAPCGLLILARSVALIAPSVMGSVYDFPVLLSTTESDEDPPGALVDCDSKCWLTYAILFILKNLQINYKI